MIKSSIDETLKLIKVMTQAMACICMLLASASALSNSPTKLYQDYVFGMSKLELKKNPTVYDCSANFEKGALCLQNQVFLGVDVELGFRFITNKLTAVFVMFEYSRHNFNRFQVALNSKFIPTMVESGGQKFDVIAKMRILGQSKLGGAFTDFEKAALSSNDVKYTYIDKESIISLGKKSSNFSDLLSKGSNNLRSAEIIVKKMDRGAISLVAFSAPKRLMALMKYNENQKNEDF